MTILINKRVISFQYRRNLNATSNDDIQRQTPISAKDYVESLHQNNRVTLLYGKNNVLVLPVIKHSVHILCFLFWQYEFTSFVCRRM